MKKPKTAAKKAMDDVNHDFQVKSGQRAGKDNANKVILAEQAQRREKLDARLNRRWGPLYKGHGAGGFLSGAVNFLRFH